MDYEEEHVSEDIPDSDFDEAVRIPVTKQAWCSQGLVELGDRRVAGCRKTRVMMRHRLRRTSDPGTGVHRSSGQDLMPWSTWQHK